MADQQYCHPIAAIARYAKMRTPIGTLNGGRVGRDRSVDIAKVELYARSLQHDVHMKRVDESALCCDSCVFDVVVSRERADTEFYPLRRPPSRPAVPGQKSIPCDA